MMKRFYVRVFGSDGAFIESRDFSKAAQACGFINVTMLDHPDREFVTGTYGDDD